MTAIEYLVKHHRVAAIPGDAFGLHDGTYLRIAYAALPADSVQEGIGRFVTGVRAFVSSTSQESR